MANILDEHLKVWNKKKILRDIYSDWYKMINHDLIPGKTVELGSGTGNYKESNSSIITSDIDKKPWIDMAFDAHQMPFKTNELSNIVMVDVLHHLQNPIKFINEAYRTLESGGKIIMLEPFPSPFSLFIYKKFHPEPFIFNIDYFTKNFVEKRKTPWESNQAIPYLLFFKNRNIFLKLFRFKFKIIKSDKLSFILYPLSGGFENKQLIPNMLVPIFKLIEILLTPLKRLFAFRCYVVLQKIK